MDSQCSIELFGGIRVAQGKRVITRFRTQKTASLLAYLAFFGDRMHSREVLSELLWPRAASQEARRLSLSVALSSLRSQLETPDVPAHSLLLADRQSIGLSSLVVTDTARFEKATRNAERARSRQERDDEKRLLLSALSIYRDNLLPGYYESWIDSQQERLAEVYRLAVRRLSSLYEEDGDLDAAIACAQRAIQSDPSDEEVSQDLIRLFLKNGGGSLQDLGYSDSSNAVKQYQRLEKALQATGHVPSPKTKALVAPLLKNFPTLPSALPMTGRKSRGGTAVAEREMAPILALSCTAAENPKTRQKSHMQVTAFQSPLIAEPDPFPNPLTRFFGREEEMSLIGRLLDSGENRLITLTGLGGTGKTRIALEIAHQFRERDSEQEEQSEEDALGIHFISLIDAGTADLFVAALRSALGVREEKHLHQDPLSSLILALQNKRTLLVLDNFEQIPDAGSEYLERLMERVPGLTCLVTSRQRLPIPGAREVPIPPLITVPFSKSLTNKPSMVPSAEWDIPGMLDSLPAVALFVDRAQLARPDFQITRRNGANIVDLVHRLEGIPLAIELAAARSQVLTPRQILDRLEKRLDLLVSHRKVTGGRHHSLREALQMSYDMLSPDLQTFFADISLFRGGFTAEAAEAVTENPIALDLLAQLCDTSLIRSVELPNGELRFQMLETIREFVCEKQEEVEQSRDQIALIESRHLRFFAGYAEQVDKRLVHGGIQSEELDLLEVEHDNFRAALRCALTRAPDHDAAGESLRLLASLHNFWMMRGHFSEGREWDRQFWHRLRTKDRPTPQSAHPPLNRALLARAVNGAGVLAMSQGDYAIADRCYRYSFWMRRRIGDRAGIAATLNNAGISYFKQGQTARARSFYERSLKEWRILGDQRFINRIVDHLAVLSAEQGDYTTARQHFAESIASSRRSGYTRGAMIGLCNLGHVYYKTNDYLVAETHLTESLSLAREIGDDSKAAASLLCLGFVRSARMATRHDQEIVSQAELDTGPQFLRIASEAYQELNLPLPGYAAAELQLFPAAVCCANGFPFTGLEALQNILERWLPEHAV